MNNLYQQLQSQNSIKLSQLPQQQQVNLIKSILTSSNPIEAVQKMGLTPKQLFYQYAQQKGVDPDQFLSSLGKN